MNNTQRPSPSSPNLSAETHLEAGEGLDVTACSASWFDLDGKTYASMMKIEEGMSMTERENILKFQLNEAKRLIRDKIA